MACAVVAGSVCSSLVRARPWWLVLADAVTAARAVTEPSYSRAARRSAR